MWICHRALARSMVHVSECERERREGKKGKARQLHTARDDARSANSATAGLSRQSPLQETQIKADLGSRDLLCAFPTGSLDPEAILFPSVPRSVERDDKDLKLRRATPTSQATLFSGIFDTHSGFPAWRCSSSPARPTRRRVSEIRMRPVNSSRRWSLS